MKFRDLDVGSGEAPKDVRPHDLSELSQDSIACAASKPPDINRRQPIQPRK
jgi:hypothetical protein